jgi:hypothetical protein
VKITVRQIATVTALCWAGLLGGVAHGQQDSGADAGAQASARADEEVIVRGRSRTMLRLQIRLAEDAIYSRFNDINGDDEYDIVCRQETLTGTHIPRRVCQPNFWRAAQARAGEEATRKLQGSFALDAQQFEAEAVTKRRLLAKKMQTLINEDPQLRQAVARLVSLKQAASNGETPVVPTASSERDTADADEPLPYDAAAVTDVQIGRKAWSHALTRHTFTIAQLYGEVRALAVQCGERSQRLEFEEGVEWTLPDDWGDCTLQVDAEPNTTFSLYEFD